VVVGRGRDQAVTREEKSTGDGAEVAEERRKWRIAHRHAAETNRGLQGDNTAWHQEVGALNQQGLIRIKRRGIGMKKRWCRA